MTRYLCFPCSQIRLHIYWGRLVLLEIIESIQSLKQAAKQRAIIHQRVCRHRSWQKHLLYIKLTSGADLMNRPPDLCLFYHSASLSASPSPSRSLILSRRLCLSVRLLGWRAALLMVEQIRAAYCSLRKRWAVALMEQKEQVLSC